MAERKPPARRTTKRATTTKATTRPTSGRARGQRRRLLDTPMIEQAEKAARAGLNNEEIVAHLGISSRAFYRWREAGDAYLALIHEAQVKDEDPPTLDDHATACVQLVQAIARARARVYEEVAGTALQEALGGGQEVVIREKTARVEVDGEFREVVVERLVTTSWRAPNPQLLALMLTRRWRHAWGTEAMPIVPPSSGEERDAVLNLLGEERVQAALRDLEAEVGRAQEQANDGKGGQS